MYYSLNGKEIKANYIYAAVKANFSSLGFNLVHSLLIRLTLQWNAPVCLYIIPSIALVFIRLIRRYFEWIACLQLQHLPTLTITWTVEQVTWLKRGNWAAGKIHEQTGKRDFPVTYSWAVNWRMRWNDETGLTVWRRGVSCRLVGAKGPCTCTCLKLIWDSVCISFILGLQNEK